MSEKERLFFGISIVCSCVHFKKEINYDEQTNAVKETHSIYIDMYWICIVTFIVNEDKCFQCLIT